MKVRVFGKTHIPVFCAACGRDVLDLNCRESDPPEQVRRSGDRTGANIATLYDGNGVIADLYVACIDDCDRRMKSRTENENNINAWKHLDDLLEPSCYLSLWCSLANRSFQQRISAVAFAKCRDILICLAPFVREGEEIAFEELRDADLGAGI